MPKYTVGEKGPVVDLNKDNFKTKGGEGSIHIIGSVVYKVCDPGRMIPQLKLKELAALDHPRIIRPDLMLFDSKKHPVGYTMKLVPGNSLPLAQILTKTYREREGVTPSHMLNLVAQIADGLRYIHGRPGYLQVDGNELNYMVTDDYGEIHFIDVNSFQTPNFPADAIMPSIRDWSVGHDASGRWQWTTLSDWYSFAIVSWYMFTGIHPFKGRHPKFPDIKTAMIDQMKAGVSVLDPDSTFPKAAVYFPFEDVIPGGKNGAYWQWFREILVNKKRLPAPDSFQATLVFVAKVKEIVGSDKFEIVMLRQYKGQITGFVEKDGKEVVITTEGLYVNNQPYPKITNRFRVGFTPKGNNAVAVTFDGTTAEVIDLESQKPVNNGRFPASDVMSYDGRLYLQVDHQVYELDFLENNTSTMVLTVPVANVMPTATKMFQGVVLQDVFGARFVSVFPESRHHRQVQMKELDGLAVTDAKFERGVLMVLAMNREQGDYTRFVFRFAADWNTYDVRRVEHVTPTGLNFTVLPNGIVVSITEEEKVEIFSNKKDSPDIKSISDPAISGDMRLCHAGAQVRRAHGDKLYTFKMK
jgi:serine/threonine protein kinase